MQSELAADDAVLGSSRNSSYSIAPTDDEGGETPVMKGDAAFEHVMRRRSASDLPSEQGEIDAELVAMLRCVDQSVEHR